jgi:iron complex transport system substrate-binding protein
MRWRITVILAITAIIASACGDDDAPAAATTSSTTTAAPVTTAAPAPTLPAAPAPVTFTGFDGVTSTIEDTSRIVVLNGDLTEVVYALGLGSQVVAIDVTTIYPAEAAELPPVGFGRRLAAEAVLAFSPTVVIGNEFIGPPEALQQLRDAGVPVVVLKNQTTLPGVGTKIREVAEVLGVPDAGATLAESVNQEIDEALALAATATAQSRVAFVYSRGPQQIFLLGNGTVTQALIEGANAIDAISVSGINGEVPLTPEALVAAAPDVIVVPASAMGAMGGEAAIGQLPGVAETPAGQNGNYLTVDDALFLNFGPRTGTALRQLILDLYPELDG